MDLQAAYLDPGNFPYEDVTAYYRSVGKHFVPEALLSELDRLRVLLRTVRGPATADLRRFLDIALDKWDSRYDYSTYIALPLLPVPDAEAADPDLADLGRVHAQRDRLLLLLIADLIAFELDAATGRTTLLPGLRPPEMLVRKRCHLALRAAAPALRRSGHADSEVHTLEPASLPMLISPNASEKDRRMLTTTMLPVCTLHDEYLFIRVLQSYESAFALMAMYLRAAVFATATNRLTEAITCIESAGKVLIDSRSLFSLLGTMQPSAFNEFRNFTEGASAIQSRNYKIVESLCREPDLDRLESTAYKSVPDVENFIKVGHLSLEQALSTARLQPFTDVGSAQKLACGMATLSDEIQRWRKTHYSLATRMLGEKKGTGHTEGTTYLAAVRTIPVFRLSADDPRVEQ